MARNKKLDREALLNSAEELICEKGSHMLTIGQVAEIAGVSKGGVQSNFGTKDKLVSALQDRWSEDLVTEIEAIRETLPADATEIDLVIEATRTYHLREAQRNMAMMLLLVQDRERRAEAKQWIEGYLDGIDDSTPEGKQKKLVFLASQGFIMLKSFGFFDATEEEWNNIYASLDSMTVTK